ncbi:MAG TPA: hypothetical protein VNF49_01285 [Candidatus Binataceae bacterium]|nr:hypothetical protein [Candidatus Binataceae bacterium]
MRVMTLSSHASPAGWCDEFSRANPATIAARIAVGRRLSIRGLLLRVPMGSATLGAIVLGWIG